MSGPKVVRVVSREELVAEAEDQLHRVDAALARCERTARRRDAWTEARAASLARRRRELRRLADAEQWPALRRAVTAEMMFLAEEHGRIVSEIEDAAERALRRRRRVADAARGIARALEAAGHPIPPALTTVGARASRASDEALPALEHEVAAAMRRLHETSVVEATDASRALAERLSRGEEGSSVAEWRATRKDEIATTDTRLLHLVAKLAALAPARAQDFAARLDAIVIEPSSTRRALLTDSVTVEIAGELERERERDATASALEAAEIRIHSIETDEAHDLRMRIANAQSTTGVDALALVRAADELVTATTLRVAATARRRAVLEGLSALGYEVREHLETAWATNGQVVLRQAGRPDYGVELAAPTDADRIQVRLVGAAAPATPRSAARDRDAETHWCSQVAELQSRLASSGTTLEIERALAIGATEVKTVSFQDAAVGATQGQAEAPRPRERTL